MEQKAKEHSISVITSQLDALRLIPIRVVEPMGGQEKPSELSEEKTT